MEDIGSGGDSDNMFYLPENFFPTGDLNYISVLFSLVFIPDVV